MSVAEAPCSKQGTYLIVFLFFLIHNAHTKAAPGAPHTCGACRPVNQPIRYTVGKFETPGAHEGLAPATFGDALVEIKIPANSSVDPNLRRG